MGAVEGWAVTHDGETLKSGFKDDFEAVAWIHKRQSQSVDWAVKHAGYDIVLVRDGKVAYSFRRAQNPTLGATELMELGAHDKRDEGTAYIDQVGGMWEARWYSKDEGRYFMVARKATRQEAVAAARREGFKPVVISPGLEGHRSQDMEAVIEYNNGIWRAKADRQFFPRIIAESRSREEVLDAVREQGYEPIFESPGLEGKKQDWSPRSGTPNPDKEPIWPEFVDAYLEAALWASSTGDNEKPLNDHGYAIWDFSKKAIAQAVKDSNAFIKTNLEALLSVGDPSQHGHDFWLTRNRHGAGFWDRGYGEVGKRLSDAARAYRETNAYVGDDKKIYFE
jgi:hypothetical protein